MSARQLALVVEDSADQTALLRRHLEREGFDVFAVTSAEAAIASFDDLAPRIAFVDLLLPGISGAEFARVIRQRFPECFLVISSVLDAVDYPPADATLPKPITGAQLRTILRQLAS